MCFWHGHEPPAPEDYQSCGECGHIWRTEADFRHDVDALLTASATAFGDPTPTPKDLDSVTYCPLCAHDL